MENTNNVNTLPLELQVNIISRLPVQQLLRLKCLSKFWHAEISNLPFSELYQNRRKSFVSSEDGFVVIVTDETIFCVNLRSNIVKELRFPPNIKSSACFLCAFNGLLLFVELNSVLWDCALYNPLTGAYAVLPSLTIDMADHPEPKFYRDTTIPCIGFGYDSQSDDLKILSLIRYKKWGSETHEAAYIYSMNLKSWKAIKSYPHGEYKCTGIRSKMVYCNDAVHWISTNDKDYVIISALNLGTEKYYTLPLPDDQKYHYTLPTPDDQFCYLVRGLAVLKGCLHIMRYSYRNGYDIWIMREYGVKQSWTRLFHCSVAKLKASFEAPVCPVPYAYLDDGQKIVLTVNRLAFNFVCCDLQTRVMEKVEINDLSLKIQSGVRRRVVSWAPSFAYPC